MMRDSCIFYQSFYEAIQMLPTIEDKCNAYESIIKYALFGDIDEENGLHQIVLKMAKPQIDANNDRYENGKKGGRPKKPMVSKNTENKKPMVSNLDGNKKPNVNVNVNDNVNDNVNVNVNPNDNVKDNDALQLFEIFEDEFSRPLGYTEMTRIQELENKYGYWMVLTALNEAIVYEKFNMNYIEQIIINWKKKGLSENDVLDGRR